MHYILTNIKDTVELIKFMHINHTKTVKKCQQFNATVSQGCINMQ